MSANVFRILLAFVFMAPFEPFPTPPYSCSCSPRGTVEEEYQRALTIFEGTVTRVSQPNEMYRRYSSLLSSLDNYVSVSSLLGSAAFTSDTQVYFAVKRAWKGVAHDEVVVYTNTGISACGYGFKEGSDYLVYGRGSEDGRLSTGFCSGTKDISRAADELAYLNTQPTLALAATPFSNSPLTCVFVPLLLLGSFLIWRTWRKQDDQNPTAR